MYDVSNKKTFDNAKDLWLKELRDSADEDSGLLSSVMLVGNKTDLEKKDGATDNFVSEELHLSEAKAHELMANRTSAKTGAGVEKAFNELIIRIYDRDKAKAKETFHPGGNVDVSAPRSNAPGKAKKCC